MATPKSSVERVLRKIRLKKPFKSRDPNFTGRIVPKKTGDNDPTRNHSDLSEDIYKLYNGDEIECDVKSALEATNKLISKCVDSELPLSFERLIEMRDELQEAVNEDIMDAPVPMMVKNVLVPYTKPFCPHCNNEIYERSTYYENNMSYHSECQKPIKWLPSRLSDPNNAESIFNGPLNPAYIKETINNLSDFYAGRNGVHAVMETVLDGEPAILFITENGQLPQGCPKDYPIKIIAEKGIPFRPE